MTDTFIVDGAGSFVVGKAQTTPEDESEGFMASAEDALGQWGMTPEEGFPRIVSGIFSGTAMLNRLLSRTGQRIGAIVTAGQEDYLVIERGIQTYLGFSYSDRLHIATHHHNAPIVERDLMKGVRGRIDVMGEEVLPLREADVKEAAEELLDAGRRGHLRLPALQLPQRRARDPRSPRSSRRPRRRMDRTATSPSTSAPSSTPCAATCPGSTRRSSRPTPPNRRGER